MKKIGSELNNEDTLSNPFQLCKNLLLAESEHNVIEILTQAGLWEENSHWRIFGDKENNYSIIGAQQANPISALVEKIVNSVDAVLMRECLIEKVDPESNEAPQSMSEALERYFGIKDGNLANVGASKRTELALNIGLVATGTRTKPNYIIFDLGEGQTPEDMPSTFLSLSESNKLRIPFVQGKFHMGGTGVLRFCGVRSLQLIITKRHPNIHSDRSNNENRWGFTVVRREDPYNGMKNSIFKYLAPYGTIPSFQNDKISIPVPTKGTQKLPELEWGTIIKLYDYEMTGFRTNIKLDLSNQISMLLPRVGMPIRFYERRGYTGHSQESTMAGLHVRLDEDKRDNVENGFPNSAEFTALDQKFKAWIYAFNLGSSVKYRKNEGILFTYSGQTHGDIPKSFFTRKKVGMSYLAESILVIVECDEIDMRTREILFMNTRDRLSSGDLRREIEKKLEEVIGNHQGLRDLREKRKREATEALLSNMKPLQEALEDVLRSSPSLQALFIKGFDISNPFKSRLVGEKEDFIGKKHPTYFRLMKGQEEKDCHVNQRFRVQFETDVENDYFIRDRYPGKFTMSLDGDDVIDRTLNLWNGIASVTISSPKGKKIGERIIGKVIVADETLIEPFHCDFIRCILGPRKVTSGTKGRKEPSGNGKGERQSPDALALPEVREVREDDWSIHGFDKFSALRVVDDGEGKYHFYVNIDNVFLKTEIKALGKNSDPRLIEARYTYGLVLFGLAMLKDREIILGRLEHDEKDTQPIEDVILNVSRAISPVLLPMIEALGSLKPEDVISYPEIEYEE